MFPFSGKMHVSSPYVKPGVTVKFVGEGVMVEPGSDITTCFPSIKEHFRNLSHLLLRDGAGVCVVH